MAKPKKHTPRGDYKALYHELQRLRQEVERLSTLREIGFATNSSLQLEEALPLIATVVQGALEVPKVTIYALEGGRLRPVVARHGNDLISAERLAEESVPRERKPFAQAIETSAVQWQRQASRQAAYVPLVAKYEVEGVMLLELPGDAEVLPEEDFLLQVAAHVSVAMNNARLYAMAVTDGLTGLFVRRYFDLRMSESFDLARRYGRVFSVVLADIDHFKRFNDTYGHQTGDQVLRVVARTIAENTRQSDIVCRYGGEEIAVVMPETGLRAGRQLAEKLCTLVREAPIQDDDGNPLSITASFGVAAYDPRYRQPGDLVKAADKALYQAKEHGRDRVVAASET